MAIKFLSGLNLSDVNAGSILKLDSNGNIVAATAGTDYVASNLWTTSGSNIYYSSGNVTIGASSNSAPLHVYAYQTTDPKILIEDGNTGDASMQFKISTQQYTMGIDNSDSDKFVLAASSALGTTNALEINTSGKITVPAATSNGAVRFEVGGYNRLRFNGGIDLLGYTQDHLWVIGNSGTNTINLGGDWDWDKQVAISYQPNTVGNAGGIMIFGQTEKNNANWTHGITKLYTNGTERLRVDSSGNVKVYGGDLDLRDPNAEDATNVLYFNANNGASTNDSNDIGTGIVWKPDYTGYSKRSAGIMQIGEGNYFKSGLAFYTNSTSDNSTDWSERMRLDMEGNLGIGVTEPSEKLHVVGNGVFHSGANLGRIKVGRSANQEIEIYVDDTNNIITAYQDSDGNSSHVFALDREFDGSGANYFEIRKGGSAQMHIDTSGNVGIGTTSPSYKLDVVGDIYSSSRVVGDDGIGSRGVFRSWSVYSYSNGILIETDIDVSTANAWDNRMIMITAYGMTYSSEPPITASFQCYNYNNGQSIISRKGISTDESLTMDVFHYNGKFYFFMEQTANYQTWHFELQTMGYQHKINSISNSAKPSTGVTNSHTITPSKWWHSDNDGTGSGLDADTVDGIQASSFARSDADDTLSGSYTFSRTSTAPALKVSGHAGANSYNYILNGSNDGGTKAVHFVNGSTRTADGGANAYTIRNDGGNLVLGSNSYDTNIYGHGININAQTDELSLQIAGTERLRVDTDGSIKLSAYGAGILKTSATGIVSVDTSTYVTDVDWSDIGSINGTININSTTQIGQGDTETLVSFQNSGTERGRFEVDDSANSYFVATGFKTTGSSTGLLKSDGTIDTSTYATTADINSFIEITDVATYLSTNNYITSSYTGFDSRYYTETEANDRFVSYENYNRGVPSTGGWYKLVKLSRGAVRIGISYTGGNMSPHTYIVEAFKDWSSTATLNVQKYGHAAYISEFRIIKESGGGNSDYYLEAYFTSITNAHSFECYFQEILGYKSVSEIFAVSSGNTLNATNSGTNTPIEALVVGSNEGLYTRNLDVNGRLYLDTLDTNTTSTSALVLGSSSEIEKRTLGSNAFTSTTYAPLASPGLTGTPTAPTAAAGTNTTQIATTAFVSTAVSNLVDSAPAALDTLNELAAALGDDADFSTTVTNSIATKVSKSGDTMTGALEIKGNVGANPVLKLYNTSNSNGATLQFSDQSTQTQTGNITFRHADSQSEGGGASFNFESEPDTVLVVGNNTNKGRIAVYSSASNSEVDYGFAGDVNTGMLRTSADNVSLVAGGVRGVGVGTTAVSLKYAGTTKLATTTSGINISGEIQLGGDSEHTISRITTSNITSEATDVTQIEGRQIDLYAYDDVWIRSGSTDDIGFVAGGATRLFIKNDGNVGVGTTSPSGKLHLEGDFESGKALVIKGTYGTDTEYYFRTHGTNSELLSLYAAGVRVMNWRSNRVDTYQGLNILGGEITTGTSNHLVIGSSVQIGQGDEDPVIEFKYGTTSLGKIDQFGDIHAGGFKVSGTTGFLKSDGSVDTSTYAASGHNHDSDYVLSTGGYYDEDFTWDGTHDFSNVIKVSGATATTTNTTALFYGTNGVIEKRDLGSNAFNSTSYLPLAGGTVTGNINLSDTNNSIGQAFFKSGGSLNLIIDSNNNQSNANFIIEKDTQTAGSGTELFRVQEDGKVGIGTNAPTQALDVNGSAYFRSTIGVNGEGNGITVDTGYSANGRVGLMKYAGLEGMLVAGSATKLRLGRRTDATSVATATTPTIAVDIQINTDGTIVFPQYGAGILKTNASGAISVDTTGYLSTAGGTLTGDLLIDTGTTGSTTQAYSAFDSLQFNNQYSSVAAGPNKIVMYDDGGNWVGGFGIHDDTTAYYSGGTHKWYKTASGPGGPTFTQKMSLDSSGNLAVTGTLSATGGTLSGALTLSSGDLTVPGYIRHNGDTDTYIVFTNNRVQIVAGNVTKFDTNNTYLVSGTDISVRNITARDIVSAADRTYSLGTDANRWQVVFCETLDSAGQHESKLQNPEGETPISEYETGTVLVWKGGKNVPCTTAADHMRMGIAVKGIESPLVQGAEPVLCTGEVKEGDYLVTSTTEGHAEAISPEFMRQHMLFDCVIGKALENGDGKSHLVKTWINI